MIWKKLLYGLHGYSQHTCLVPCLDSKQLRFHGAHPNVQPILFTVCWQVKWQQLQKKRAT